MNYKIAIEARHLAHILKDHGRNGKADHSLSDDNDIAKIQFVLNEYDNISYGGKTQAYSTYRNGKNRTADTVLYEKNIGSKSYYVVQTIVDTNKKTLYIVTAFIGESNLAIKKGNPQLINAKSPNETSVNETVVSPVNMIPLTSEKNNTPDGKKSKDDTIDADYLSAVEQSKSDRGLWAREYP